MQIKNNILYGILISLCIILAWVYYAYKYRTSSMRLSMLASQKYSRIASDEVKSKYVIQCDSTKSTYDATNNIFHAVITIKPDMNNPKAPLKPDIMKDYKVVFDDSHCNISNANEFISCINVN